MHKRKSLAMAGDFYLYLRLATYFFMMNSSHLFGWLSGFMPAVHHSKSHSQSLNLFKMDSEEKDLQDLIEEQEGRLKELTELTGLLNKLKQYLYNYYEPVQNPKEAEFTFSTDEIWRQFLRIFPDELVLTKEIVAAWLHSGGFTFYDFGQMKFEWLLKKANKYLPYESQH